MSVTVETTRKPISITPHGGAVLVGDDAALQSMDFNGSYISLYNSEYVDLEFDSFTLPEGATWPGTDTPGAFVGFRYTGRLESDYSIGWSPSLILMPRGSSLARPDYLTTTLYEDRERVSYYAQPASIMRDFASQPFVAQVRHDSSFPPRIYVTWFELIFRYDLPDDACSTDLPLHLDSTTGAAITVGADPLADDDAGTYVELHWPEGGERDRAWCHLPPLSQRAADGAYDVTFNIVTSTPENAEALATAVLSRSGDDYVTGFHPGGAYLTLTPGAEQLTSFTPDAQHYAYDYETPESVIEALAGGATMLLRVGSAWSSPTIIVHKAWITVRHVCFTAVTIAPPLRQWPRSDGLGMSSVRRVWPNTPSVQRSLRQGPGAYL